MAVERTSDYWRERYAGAGVPLHEIAASTSTSKLYWLTFPRRLRSDRRALDSVVSGRDVGSLVSSFFPMNHLLASIGKRRQLRHVHLCFEPFPFFHDREVIGLYPTSSQVLMRDSGSSTGASTATGARGRRAADPQRGDSGLHRARLRQTRRDPDLRRGRPGLLPPVPRGRPGGPAGAPWTRPVRDPLDGLLAHQAHGSRASSLRGSGRDGARLLVTSTIDDPQAWQRCARTRASSASPIRWTTWGSSPTRNSPLLLARRRAAADRHVGELGRDVDVAPREGGARMRHGGHPLGRHRGGCRGRRQRVPRRSERLARRRSAPRGAARDPSARAAFGEAGRVRITALYRWDRVVDLVDRAIG